MPDYKCDYCGKTCSDPDAGPPDPDFSMACDECYKCFQQELCYICKKPVHPGFLICEDHLECD